MKTILALICSTLALYSAAQQNQTPCTAPEASQFDFWMGDWTLTWSDTLHGTNHIEKIMGGCTVQENFNAPNANYTGKSWSVYNANYKIWQQTWVDNQGGYIALNGGMNGDSMVLTTGEQTVPASLSPTGKLMSRMVYHNITKQSFDWSWEASTDGGNTWKPSWQIHYQRKS